MTPGRLVSRAQAAAGQLRVALSVDPTTRAEHRAAGQFLELYPDTADHGYFALLNAPGEGELLELLVRTDAPSGGEAAARLTAAALGDAIPLRGPLGAGFPLERAAGRGLRVVCTGTAIAPARAAVVAFEGAVLSLDYGVRSDDHVALRSELDRFAARGIAVAIHRSTPGASGPVGPVAQDGLEARWDEGAAAREAVLVVGQPELAEDVRRRWVLRGGDPRHVLTNV